VSDLETIIRYSKDMVLLYVEDNDDAREMFQIILEMFFDTIHTARDGYEGLETFKSHSIDLVITDINMPRLNGLKMIEQIRKIQENIPILVLTAYNEESYLMESIRLNVDGYLLKPVDTDNMTVMLDKIVMLRHYQRQTQKNLLFLKAYQEAADQSSSVSRMDTGGIITYVNDSFCELSGYERDLLIGQHHSVVRHPDTPLEVTEEIRRTIYDEKTTWKGILRNRNRDGNSYYVDTVIVPLLNPENEIVEFISLRKDVTELLHPLSQLKDAIRHTSDPILVYMRLHNFETLEEFYGEEVINEIQINAERQLEKRFATAFAFERLYRLGNGDFAFLLDRKTYRGDERSLIRSLKHIQHLIREERIDLYRSEGDMVILMSVSYDRNRILESAKLGIRKLVKKQRHFIVSNNLASFKQAKARRNIQTASVIQDAIDHSRVIAYFQPIVDNRTRQIVKYETLVRLIDAQGNVLSPSHFLEAAKKSDLYPQITEKILSYAFSFLKKNDFDITVNLSILDVEQTLTRKKIFALLKEHQNHAHRMVFELLEDENVRDLSIVKHFVTQVKHYGAKIAIDDFGAGYSNYERLLEYQPDILKIDGSLVRNIATDSYSLSVVKSIVTFAREQNLQTVAEYIENEAIFDVVKNLGVDYSQGYYFGKPLAPDEHQES
jgi:PAS domain S-box-containing protein